MRYLTIAALLLAGCAAHHRPQAPGRTTVTGGQLTKTEGRVDGYTTAARGEMDGLVLSNGARVHFPPHAGLSVLPLVGKGSTVRVIGQETQGPEGRVIEATRITDPTTGVTVDVTAIAPPPPSPGAVAPPVRPALRPNQAPSPHTR